MAGSIAVTSEALGSTLVKFTFDWTSDAAGAVSGTDTDLPTGEIVGVGFTPDGGGTQPTDLYDVTLQDPANRDVLEGEGANLGNAASQWRVPAVNTSFPRYIEAGAHELVVANAGNAKGGLVELFIRLV